MYVMNDLCFFFKSKKQLYIYVLVYEFIKLVCIMIFYPYTLLKMSLF